jgi:HTH-type transcriptional regulator/antitoxin HigA
VKGRTGSRGDYAALVRAWEGVRHKLPEFGPIRDQRSYVQMKGLMDRILELVGDDEDHELADLLDIVSTLVMQYEGRTEPELPPVEPREVLRFLMEQHRLKQTDLRREIGSQGVVSEILSGKRILNTRQVRALARRFGVSPTVFIG